MRPENTPRAGVSVELIALTKVYGDTTVVDHVELAVEPGEFMTFLGPSGSGKTTTLNLIAGFTSPSSGGIRVNGQSVETTPPYKRNMGMVFQGYALFPHMSVGDNIEYPLKFRRMNKSERRRRVTDALETVRLGPLQDRRPAQLSGGQQQRVAFARAIVYGAPLLLMDEPLGALDKKLREELQEEIHRIHRRLGTTFLFVTHDQEEALALSDRVAVFNNGKIAQVGTAEEVYSRPKDLFVANFLGESTTLCGQVYSGAGHLRFGSLDLAIPRTHGLDGKAAVVVRPERLRLTSTAPKAGSLNSVPVVVEDELYMGHSRRLTISLPDGSTGHVRETSKNRSPLVIGESGFVSWHADDGVLVPIEASTVATQEDGLSTAAF